MRQLVLVELGEFGVALAAGDVTDDGDPVRRSARIRKQERREREFCIERLAIGAVQMTLDLGESREWFASKLIQITALIALATGAIFVWRGWSLRENIIDFSILRDRSFAAANVAIMMVARYPG